MVDLQANSVNSPRTAWWIAEVSKLAEEKAKQGETLPESTLRLLASFQGLTSPVEDLYLEPLDTYDFTTSPTENLKGTLTVSDEVWEKKTKRFNLELRLRNFLRLSGVRYTNDCRRDWQWYCLGDKRRLQPYCCNERGRCPHCAVKYGYQQGEELVSVMWAALSRFQGERSRGEPLSWHIVMTYPPVLQAYLLALIASNDTKQLKKELKRLTPLVKRYLGTLYKTHESQVTASINHHYWHSKNPLSEPFMHMHVIVPNVTKACQRLSRRGDFSVSRLAEARRQWWNDLAAAYPELDIPEGANIWLEFTKNNVEGRLKLAHDCRYATRHALADLLAHGVPTDTERNRRAVKRFVQVAELMQKVKLRRYIGFLAPSQRKKHGLVKQESTPSGEDRWQPESGGFRRFIRWLPDGVLMRAWDWGVEYVEKVSRDEVRMSIPAPPVTWVFDIGF